MGTALVGISLFAFSCKKDDKTIAEPQSKVKVLNFGTRTFTGATDYELTGLTQAEIDSSAVLAYYTPSNEASTAWYAISDYGSNASYYVRALIVQISPEKIAMRLRLLQPNGAAYASPVTFTRFKVVIVPATDVASISSQVNINNYKAVENLYQLKN